MTWFMAGSAAVSVGTSYLGGISNANAGIRNANATSKAEGEAIAKERLNTTIRNSYNAAFGQMRLALQKRQAAQAGSQISAATLAARGEADVAAAATGSVGASTVAIASDIQQKSQEAFAAMEANFENEVENYNTDLTLMRLNTAESSPTTRPVQDSGPSSGEIFGGAVLGGLAQFASNYANRKMQLGLGDRPTPQVPRTYNALQLNLRQRF